MSNSNQAKVKKCQKKGKAIFLVQVTWEVGKEYEVEASSRQEAKKSIQDLIDQGEVCVWTDGYEAGDKVTVKVTGRE